LQASISAQQADDIALTYIYGIGAPRAASILERPKWIHEKDPGPGRGRGEPYPPGVEAEGMVEGDLRKEVSMNIKRLIEIGSYRGYRHRRNLPVRDNGPTPTRRTRRAREKAPWRQEEIGRSKT